MARDKESGVPTNALSLLMTPSAPRGEPGDGPDAPPGEPGAEGRGGPPADARLAGSARSRRPRQPAATGKAKSRNLYIPDEVYKRLSLNALEKGETASAIVTRILNANLPHYDFKRIRD
jgi:hypothetical protein